MTRKMAVLITASQLAFAADLPVKQVVLYKHGVGFFERSGAVKPGDSARLDFKASDMNDVLKSLTVVDRGGGKVTGVRYDSSEPLAVKLGDFSFALGNETTLASFLDQCKGARLELQVGRDLFSGIILGARTEKGKDGGESNQTVNLLQDSNEIRTLSLSTATSVRFMEPELQRKLREYLSAVNAARATEKRSVYIDGSGSAARELDVSYMTPTPVWKSSYRLLLPETGEPTLEGWAIIDNTTGEDWSAVSLALVSGRPISFISPLYEPRYRTRPVADLPDQAAAMPTVYEGNLSNAAAAPAPPPPPAVAMPMAEGRMKKQVRQQQYAMNAQQNMAVDGAVSMDKAEAMSAPGQASSFGAAAEGRDAGELFEYRFSNPVTVKKSESAMLPFLQSHIKARKLLVYSLENSSLNPQNAAELINSSGKTLDGGPITVYEAKSYAGEGLIDTLKIGDKRLIGYSVDLGTRISTKFDSGQQIIREIHANHGLLTTKIAVEETRTYTIRNVDAKEKTLMIEYPVRSEYKLLNQKPSATSSSAYRFEVKLDPNKTTTFPVSEEQILQNAILVSNLTPDILGSYVSNKVLSDAGRKQLQQVSSLKSQIADLDNQIKRLEADATSLTNDQQRIRQNISTLNQVSGQQAQVQKYSATLATQEAQLAAQRDKQTELRNKKAALETELNALLERLDF
jgi:hypothetical protein